MLSPAYLMPPSRTGVLSAILERTKGLPDHYVNTFDVLDDEALYVFKAWMEREDVRTLTSNDIAVLRQIPMYHTTSGRTSLDGCDQHKYIRQLNNMLVGLDDDDLIRSVIPPGKCRGDCCVHRGSTVECL